MEKKKLFIVITILVLVLAVFRKREWWENTYSSKELAILDLMECNILNKLDQIEEKIDQLKRY